MGSRACGVCSGCMRVGGESTCCLRLRNWRGWRRTSSQCRKLQQLPLPEIADDQQLPLPVPEIADDQLRPFDDIGGHDVIHDAITFLETSSDDMEAGGHDVIHDAITFLEMSSDDMKTVCLHGMGGIGKSFLGLKIFRQFQGSKYRNCRVELQFDTKEGELCDIQRQIVEKVCKHAISKISNLSDGRRILERELKQINDPIFLYVDNVLDPQYLPTLLPNAAFFPKGSRILITSRGEYIKQGIVELGITHYKLIEVRTLQTQQARRLLWKQLVTSKGEHTEISEVKSLEERVLADCDGLPLALIVVGQYINANENGPKNVEVWHEVVRSMEKAEALDGIVHDKRYSMVSFSIENLYPNVKRAFFDMISFVDINWPGVLAWESLERLVSHKYLRVLCQRALVLKKERSFKSPSSAEIHDVIKAMGKRLLENERHELRITGMDKLKEHKNDLKKVVALYDVTMDAYLVKQMPLLRLLQDIKVVFEDECQEIQLRHLRVVRGMWWSTFRVFDWSECASLKEITACADDREASFNLEVLKHGKISMTLEALTLNGREGSQLLNLDVIEDFMCLKELRLISCQGTEFLPEGISRLFGLKELQLSYCGKLKCLPQGISRLVGLEVLDLKYCKSVQSLPEGLTSLTGLTELILDECQSLQSIPEGIGNLRAVTHFTLSGCKSLQSIPEDATSLMSGLTELSLAYCARIKYLPEGVTRLTGLTKLDLSRCHSLRSLPEGVSGLTGLTSLSMWGCQRLQALPEGIASLSHLIELNLRWCNALQALPNELSSSSGLTTLRLDECRSLQFLPDDMSKLTGLVHLHLYGCKSLRSIEGVTTLVALRILDLRNCTELQSLPEGCTRLTSLRCVYLSGCRSLKSIPEATLGHLAGLHRLPGDSIQDEEEEEVVVEMNCLNLKDCESLKSLPQSIGSFSHLERLDLENCTSLQSLPEGVTRLSNLATLNLLGCRSLQCLPRGLIGSLTGLTELKLGECAIQLQPLLEEVSCSLTRLKVLQLSGCEDLQSLPQGITSLIRLKVLSLLGCRNFQMLPQGMANWRGLRTLELSGCQSLQYLPEELTTLTALCDLNLSGCAGLRCLPEGLAAFTDLWNLDLSGCAGLQSLPEGLTALTDLWNLNLSGCAGLRSLPQGIFTSLARLTRLSMSKCGGLQLEESQGITMLTRLTSLDLSESDHLLFLLSEQGLASVAFSLQQLSLSGCRSLQFLPEGVAALTTLDWLNLSGCASLQSLSNLPQGSLHWLYLGGCGSLDQPSVWERILSLRELRTLHLSGWETMQALPDGIASLKRLGELDLSDCSSLLSLPESVTKLTNLRELSLAECKCLQNLPPGITSLVELERLDLSGCTSLEPLPEEITIWISGIQDYRPNLHESSPQ